VLAATTLALLLHVAPGCSGPQTAGRAATESPPNVVLIVLDTVRADHLGCYGYARAISPRIDGFARNATRYTRSVSAAPWTVPSHGSLFTGRPPFVHGAHTFAVESPTKNVNPLPLDRVTLAETLHSAGYRTAAFVANVAYLAPHWQLDQGFETYHVERLHGDALNQHVFSWLEQVTTPFFLFVNYIDAHRPYNTTPRPGLLDPPAEHGPELLDQLVEQVMPATGPVPEALARKVVDQYDTAIANLDEQIGVLLNRLEQSGVAENTVIVITSDHGEYFGEHQLVEHSKDIYQEAIRVPLILRGPGQRDGTIDDTLVVSNDVPRLILAEFPEGARERLSAPFPDLPGEHLVVAENYFTRRKDLFDPRWGWRFQRIRRAVFDWPYKLIHSSDGQHELYDLEQDPSEQRNLIDERREIADRLALALAELDAADPSGPLEPDTTPLDEELRKRLEALGYVD
jgi:arylsulfatase A-like enzyme